MIHLVDMAIQVVEADSFQSLNIVQK